MGQKNKRSGVSIAEMCIVIAVLAIASTVVVTFTAMVGARSSTSATKLRAMEDVQVSQAILENWVDRMAALDAQITANNAGLSATAAGKTYRVKLEEDRLVAQLPGDSNLYCPIGIMKQFRFDQMTKADSNPLIFCTAVYTVKNTAGEETEITHTFTILSRVGEIVSP